MIVHPLITFSDLCDTKSALKYINFLEPHGYTHNIGKFETPMYCSLEKKERRGFE